MKLTAIEQIFWDTYQNWKDGNITICNRLGYDSTMQLIPQHQLATKSNVYLIDFAETTTKIAIELDGFEWHYQNKDQVIKDKKRERAIILEDYTILRYPGAEVYNNPEEVLEEVYFTYCLKCIHSVKDNEVISG